MRHLRIGTLLTLLPISVFAQSTRTNTEPRRTTNSEFSITAASVARWEDRLQDHDSKIRTTAATALVQGAPQSLPLLKTILEGPNESLQSATLELLRRIGPPAIPLLVDLLRDPRVS